MNWSKYPLDIIVHSSDVTRDSSSLNVFIELDLVLIDAVLSHLLNIAPCSFKSLKVLFIRSLLVLSKSGVFGCNEGCHFKGFCCKPVIKFKGFLCKSGQGCATDSVSLLFPLLCCQHSGLKDAKFLFKGDSKLLLEFCFRHLARVNAGLFFLSGMVKFLLLHPDPAAHTRMVCITIYTLVGMGFIE